MVTKRNLIESGPPPEGPAPILSHRSYAGDPNALKCWSGGWTSENGTETAPADRARKKSSALVSILIVAAKMPYRSAVRAFALRQLNSVTQKRSAPCDRTRPPLTAA